MIKMKKRILCYGDSNTWGYIAGSVKEDSPYIGRYSPDIRWTGRLQKLLGDDYLIIEEGLNGRTTNLDYTDFVGRNGKTYLFPCVYSHAPLDLVVLMIGCNDFKSFFNRSASDVAEGVLELIQLIQSTSYGPDMISAPNILLIGYPIIKHELGYEGLFKDGVEKSKEFNKLLSNVAIKYNIPFLDAAPHIKLSDIDGLHFTEEDHEEFSKLLLDKIKSMFVN